MNRRIALTLAAALGLTLAFPLAARADQAILVRDAVFEIGPGEVVDHTDVLAIVPAGIPTVVFDGATGFAADETVVATITLSMQDLDGLGTVDLLSSPTISGTTSADWPSVESNALELQPAIELRYTAPTATDLECDVNPGQRFTTHLGVSATLVGSAGTMASFAADDFPGVVSFVITCPASSVGDPGVGGTTVTVTPPPTYTLPAPEDTRSRAALPAQLLFLAVVAGVGALVVLARPPITRRYRS
jgi:hypothetical protein